MCMLRSYVNDARLNVNEIWLTPLAYKRVLKWHTKEFRTVEGEMVFTCFNSEICAPATEKARIMIAFKALITPHSDCLLYTSPSPRD